MSMDDPDLPPLPDLRSDEVIQDSRGFEFNGSVRAIDPGNIVTVVITKTRGNVAFVLNDRRGYFRFGNPGHPFVGAMKAIQMCMHSQVVPGYVPWLRTLLLAHENQAITLPVAPRITGAWREHFHTLNAEQEEALAQSCCRGRTLGERFNMIQGPPGTGKTTVIGQIAVNNLTLGRKFLVVAETRFAVKVVAAAITKAAETARLENVRVFLVEHSGAKGMEYDVEEPEHEREDWTDSDEEEGIEELYYSAARALLPFMGTVDLDDLAEDERNCPICYEEFSSLDRPTVLKCKHVVGQECMKRGYRIAITLVPCVVRRFLTRYM